MILYSVKFAMNQGTKNQKMGCFRLSLNDYIFCEICYEQRHKESETKYFTSHLNDYIV